MKNNFRYKYTNINEQNSTRNLLHHADSQDQSPCSRSFWSLCYRNIYIYIYAICPTLSSPSGENSHLQTSWCSFIVLQITSRTQIRTSVKQTCAITSHPRHSREAWRIWIQVYFTLLYSILVSIEPEAGNCNSLSSEMKVNRGLLPTLSLWTKQSVSVSPTHSVWR